MKLRAFAVYDSKVQAYMQPFFSRTAGEALRSWEALINDGKSTPSQYPADFTLFELGEYDEQSGKLTSHETPRSLGVGIEVKRNLDNVSALKKPAGMIE